ncbi:hypothetical protein COOONC_10121 [Cooperia oncophora]
MRSRGQLLLWISSSEATFCADLYHYYCVQLDKLSCRIAECGASITELEKRRTMLEMSINDLEGSHAKRRVLEDQLTRMLVVGRISSVEKELAELVCPGEEKDVIYKERDVSSFSIASVESI